MVKSTKKTVLAFDTAMGGISVGVIATNGHIVSRQVETQRGQAAMLIPVIQEVLDEAQIGFKDIELLVSTIGPGSFTGLRIGLTTAKVLSLSLNIPLIGLNTLEVMAHHYDTDKPLLIVLETKRKDFYAQYFDIAQKRGFDTPRPYLSGAFSALADAVLSCAPVTDFYIGGDCLSRFQQSVTKDLMVLDNWVQPDPIIMAQVGLRKFEAGGGQVSIEPLYLHDADVSAPKNPPRKLSQF